MKKGLIQGRTFRKYYRRTEFMGMVCKALGMHGVILQTTVTQEESLECS